MQSDWKELIASLTSHGVEFMVAGAHVLAFHARPRYTEDLDLFLRRSAENGKRLQAAMNDFGIPLPDNVIDQLMNQDRQMFYVGSEPNVVDFLNFLSGVEFETAWQRKAPGKLLGEPVWYLSLEDFRATKIASGRPKDLTDLVFLDEIMG